MYKTYSSSGSLVLHVRVVPNNKLMLNGSCFPTFYVVFLNAEKVIASGGYVSRVVFSWYKF